VPPGGSLEIILIYGKCLHKVSLRPTVWHVLTEQKQISAGHGGTCLCFQHWKDGGMKIVSSRSAQATKKQTNKKKKQVIYPRPANCFLF
jgi:hypothetical protein